MHFNFALGPANYVDSPERTPYFKRLLFFSPKPPLSVPDSGATLFPITWACEQRGSVVSQTTLKAATHFESTLILHLCLPQPPHCAALPVSLSPGLENTLPTSLPPAGFSTPHLPCPPTPGYSHQGREGVAAFSCPSLSTHLTLS